MMNRMNNILVGLLWLLASTLGATFWFNTMFGFNIFAAQHWQHLAYMQATDQSVKPTFYISIIVIVFIMIFGLYKLLQPRVRRISTPIFDRSAQPNTANQPIHDPAPIAPEAPKQTTVEQPVSAPETVAAPAAPRPPRLNIPNVPRSTPVPHVPLTSTPQQPASTMNVEYADIHDIFKSAGYVYKGMPKIKNVQMAIVAIGTNEVLWMGAVGISDAEMQRAVQALSGVFSDTLDDIEININAFIVAPSNADNTDVNILHFATVDDLRNYIMAKPNTPPDADESENFDAYSGYIGTVMDYIGKI